MRPAAIIIIKYQLIKGLFVFIDCGAPWVKYLFNIEEGLYLLEVICLFPWLNSWFILLFYVLFGWKEVKILDSVASATYNVTYNKIQRFAYITLDLYDVCLDGYNRMTLENNSK